MLKNNMSRLLEITREQSKRGGRVAVFHQYKYNWRRLNGDSTEYWNCRDKSENGVPCGATITTKFDQVTKINKMMYSDTSIAVLDNTLDQTVKASHNHEPTKKEEIVPIEGAMANMALRASSENIAIGEIYRQEQTKLVQSLGSEAAAAALPPLRSIQTRLYRAKHAAFPKLPKNLHDFVINDNTNKEYSESLVGNRRLLLHNSSCAPDQRIMIFSSDEQIKCLASCSRWGADGTFDSASQFFYQVYIIFGFVEDECLPLCWALLTGKDTTSYSQILTELKIKAAALGVKLDPKVICTDFEKAAHKVYCLINCVMYLL
jgi:hypothetical protein